MNFCLVQLIPKDMRGKESINLGLQIIKNKITEYGWNVDVVQFGEIIDKDKYDIIGFSVFYVTHQLNLVPFLKANGIEPLAEKRNRKPLLIAGGQGIQNPRPISKFIDIFNIGEGEETIIKLLKAYETNSVDELADEIGFYFPQNSNNITFSRVNKLISEPIIFKNRAMIELNRGCKHRCKFCQYGYTAGRYREKDVELVKRQIDEVQVQGAKGINFLSCNLGGYSSIVELLKYCIDKKVRVMNTDMRVDEYSEEVAILLDKLKVRTLKFGLESFTEETRFDINKRITNKMLDEFIDRALKYNISNLHFYLIYGLPTETNYEQWFVYIKKLKEKIQAVDRNIRLEFSITNFEPALFTPYEKYPQIDFEEKHKFLKMYLKALEENGYIANAENSWYGNMKGRIGRKPESYKITMWLFHGDESVGDVLLDLKISGVGRSIKSTVYEKIKKLGVDL